MVEGLGGRQELSEVEIQRPQFRFFDFISENTGKMEAFQARQAHMTTHHLGTWRFANVNSDLFRASTSAARTSSTEQPGGGIQM